MKNTQRAVKGDVVRYVGDECFDLTIGKLYVITEVSSVGSSYAACFTDDIGYPRAFWYPEKYEIVGTAQDVLNRPVLATLPSLKDIHGQTVSTGDYVAFAYTGFANCHLAVFEVLDVNPNSQTARVRSTTDSSVMVVGVFEERALKLKDFNK